MKIGIIGGGAFGTALAANYAHAERDVVLWMRDEKCCREINQSRRNSKYLPEISLPKGILATTRISDISQTELNLLVLPAQKTREWLVENGKYLNDRPLLACAKGVDMTNHKVQTDLIQDAIPNIKTGAISGPGFAVEIASGLPTALSIASSDPKILDDLQSQLSTRSLRLYASSDLRGVQIGGALKNVIAIAAGITIGAGLGQSARSSIITRGLAEMLKIASLYHIEPATLTGLSGLGDLILSATSSTSRNYQMGISLGRGENGNIGKTTEGAFTARAIAEQAPLNKLDLPICQGVDRLIQNEISVKMLINNLLNRPLKKET